MWKRKVLLLPAKSSHRLVSRTPYKHKKNLQLRTFNICSDGQL